MEMEHLSPYSIYSAIHTVIQNDSCKWKGFSFIKNSWEWARFMWRCEKGIEKTEKEAKKIVNSHDLASAASGV